MADIKPTPTQEENDRAALGEHVIDKEPDGSAPQDGAGGGGGETPAPPAIPVVDSISPINGPLPDVSLAVTGQNFTAESVVVFDGVEQPTTFGTATDISAAITYAGVAGTYPVLVRDPAGDSNAVTFDFTDPVAGDAQSADEHARGRRRR